MLITPKNIVQLLYKGALDLEDILGTGIFQWAPFGIKPVFRIRIRINTCLLDPDPGGKKA